MQTVELVEGKAPNAVDLHVGARVRMRRKFLGLSQEGLADTQYGASLDYETCQGAGGLSSSAIDLARLIAMFNANGPEPVLSAKTMEIMLANANNCTFTYTGPNPPGSVHGYHGLDWYRNIGGGIRGQKGGWLPSHESIIDWYKDGYGLVMLVNGNKRAEAAWTVKGVSVGWIDKLYDVVKSIPWDETDLFNQYGMNSLQLDIKAKAFVMPVLSQEAVVKTEMTKSQEIAIMTSSSLERMKPTRSPSTRPNGRLTFKKPAQPRRTRGA